MRTLASILLILATSGCQSETDNASGPDTSNGSVVSGAGTGPFGIDLAKSPDELGAELLEGGKAEGIFHLKSVPRPSSEFTSYFLVAPDSKTICEVRAASKELDGDSLGVQVRSQVDELAQALSIKYGQSKKYDVCGGGDVSCQGQFWSMSVMNGERVYGYEWANPVSDAKIRNIAITVSTTQFADPWYRLDYKTNDAGRCKIASQRARSKDL